MTQERVLSEWTLHRENDCSGIIDSCRCCGRPHTPYPVAKIRFLTHFINQYF